MSQERSGSFLSSRRLSYDILQSIIEWMMDTADILKKMKVPDLAPDHFHCDVTRKEDPPHQEEEVLLDLIFVLPCLYGPSIGRLLVPS